MIVIDAPLNYSVERVSIYSSLFNVRDGMDARMCLTNVKGFCEAVKRSERHLVPLAYIISFELDAVR